MKAYLLLIWAVLLCYCQFTPVLAQKMPGNLQDAIKAGNVPALHKILQANPTLLNSKDNDLNTPLMLAVRLKKADVAAALLERKANVLLANAEGETALHLACAHGATGQNLVEMLAEKKAPFLARTRAGDTPLHYAIAQGQSDGDYVQYLVGKGAKANAPNNAGEIPLYTALLDPKTPARTVDYLIASGSNLQAALRDGRRAVHLAAELGTAPVLTTILDKTVTKPVQLNVADNKGRTALHCAAQAFNTVNVELLLTRGMDINIKDRLGNTPLHSVCLSKATGADKQKAHQNQLAVAKLLLDKGANALAKNRAGDTPFDLADNADNFVLKKLIKTCLNKLEDEQDAKNKAANKQDKAKAEAKKKAPGTKQ